MKSVILLILVIAVTSITYSEEVILKIDFQNTQPKYIELDDGNFEGLCCELIKLIEENSEYRFENSNKLASLRRVIYNIENNVSDVHLGLLKNAEREKTMKYGEPLYKRKLVFISKKNEPIIINSLEDIIKLGDKGKVFSLAGNSTNNALKEKGIIIDDNHNTPEQLVLKLLHPREARFALYHDLGFNYQLNKKLYANKFKIHPFILNERYHYMVFSNKVSQETIDGIAKVIKALKASGKWSEVLIKYGLSL